MESKFMFSGYGEARDYVNGTKPTTKLSGNDFVTFIGEDKDEFSGRGKFNVVAVGTELRTPHLKLFSIDGCPFCDAMHTKIVTMKNIFERLGLDIPIYEIDGNDKENTGNKILEAVSDVIGYPTLRYFSDTGVGVTYDHKNGDSAKTFSDDVMRMMSMIEGDTTTLEGFDKMNKYLSKLIPTP